MLQIYDSLTREKKPFQPIKPNTVQMYLCGITVYDYCHIGHARTAVFCDVMARYFTFCGYDVRYVRNITDIDDKIINRALESGIPWTEVTQKYIEAMHEDYDKLGINRPTIEPKATDSILEIIKMVKTLEEKGVAYQGASGDVYYDTSKFESYGGLAQQSLDSLQAGSRIEVTDEKKNPMDFVLWKKAKPGEPLWDSPWGEGRPGWHIECSAMSTTHLANTFDIHCGGNDLKFPHHENERAQSEAATGCHFVNYWMHVGFVNIDNEKMSKSLNNFFTIRDVLTHYHQEVIRYFLLFSHYRSPVNYSKDNLEQAKNSLTTLYTALRGVEFAKDAAIISSYQEKFQAAMDDDFNLPGALSVLFELAKAVNTHRDSNPDEAGSLANTLYQLSGVLGICQSDPEVFFKGDEGVDASKVDALITARNEARQTKNWARADEIRDELAEMGVVIEDGASGTTWRVT